jgi:hypothetical protein
LRAGTGAAATFERAGFAAHFDPWLRRRLIPTLTRARFPAISGQLLRDSDCAVWLRGNDRSRSLHLRVIRGRDFVASNHEELSHA